MGFYGLDLYSLHASMQAVLEYLEKVDPEAARRAARRYGCFDHFGTDPQEYGYATAFGLSPSCEREVLSQLVELRASAAEYARRDGRLEPDELFFAEQNAKVVRSAEEYYRAMFRSRTGSWNLRDQHMADTLNALLGFLETQGPRSKVVVWAHNSHLGDARATEMGAGGELNLGQLVREQFGHEAVLVGFTTYSGTVTAASDWGCAGGAEGRSPRAARQLRGTVPLRAVATSTSTSMARRHSWRPSITPRLERAIGVIYRPETERMSHYFHAHLPRQFDAVFHYDHTRAVEPLDRTAAWERGEAELPETFPFRALRP